MIVYVDHDGAAPLHTQIVDQFSELIFTGALPEGAKLPTIRQLAGDLGVANNTVGRAYQELEQHGLVRAGRRRGTVVAAISDDHRVTVARSELAVVIARLRGLGLSTNQLRDLALDELNDKVPDESVEIAASHVS